MVALLWACCMTSAGQSAETVAKEPPELIRLRAENRLLRATLKQRNEEIAALKATLKQRNEEIASLKPSVVVDPKGLKVGGTYRLPRGAPLMPELNPSDPLAAIRKMLQVPPGGSIAVISVSEKRGIPWYQVDAYDAVKEVIGRGWVNSTALVGQRLDRVVKEAVPVPNRKEQRTTAETAGSTADGIPKASGTDQEKAISAMDERIRKAYRADPDRPLLSALRFEGRKVTRIGKGSYEMVVVCSIVYPDRPTQRDRTRWHIRATHGPNGWQAELASLPEAP